MTPATRFRPSTSARGFAVALALSGAGPAIADENSASKILKGMTDHLMAQASLSLKYDSDVEVVTPSLQKIQFSASGEVALTRPDKFRVSRTGGYADIEIVSDGSAVTVHDRDGRKFAQVQVQGGGGFDQLVAKLRNDLAVEIPGADLLLSNAFEELTSGVLEGRVIGKGVVDGVECDHLAFRNLDTDWQIWIEPGERPLPRKYVITSKTLATAPQYTLRLTDWKAGIAIASHVFDFTPPSGTSRVERASLSNVDEIPAAATEEEFINARR